MKRQRFKFKLLAFFLFALFALLGTYGMHSIALYGNRWFTYAKNPRVRAQKQNVVPGDILDRSGVVLATSSVSEDGTVTRVYQANEAARRAVVHLLGDSDGQVANGVESFQTAYLYGFQTGIWERIQALVTGQKRHGDNVTLTVDSSLCTAILQSFQRRASGKAGAAVVMNYKTGEVLGMVSLPTFDPMSSSAVSASSNAYWNRVTQNPYTPGSTFKLVTAAAQLRVNPSAQTMQVNCTGNLTVDGQVIHDYGSASHGAIDLKTAFMRSCNNAFAQYALSMGDKALREAAESMKRSYSVNDPEKASDEANTIHNPVVKDNEAAHEGVTPAAAQTQASSPEQKPETTPEPVVKPAADAEPKTAAPSPSSSDKP